MNVRARLWVEDKLVSDETVDVDGDDMEALAYKHATLFGDQPHMIEFEFLDEPDVMKRFLRMGTDPRRMVAPIEVDISGCG